MKGRIIKTFAVIMTLVLLCGESVLAAPKTMADGGGFDPEYYAQQNPDVVAALGMDENVLYQHYLNNGKKEGRMPCAPENVTQSSAASTIQTMSDGGLFDPYFYAATYTDVATLIGTDATTLYNHYKTNGVAMGRVPYAGATPTTSRLIGTYTTANDRKKQGGTYNFYLRNNFPEFVTVSQRGGKKQKYGVYDLKSMSAVRTGEHPEFVTSYTSVAEGSELPSCYVDAILYDEAGTIISIEYVRLRADQTIATTVFRPFDGLPGNYYIELTK